MKKNDSYLDILIYYIIAEKDNRIYKIYYIDYQKFLRELKYYVIGGYSVQVGTRKKQIEVC